MVSPFLPRRTRPLDLLVRTAPVLNRPRQSGGPSHSLISNYNLYNVSDMRLNNKKVGCIASV
jgi:hypothetical protein